jgi:hypothetical protein
MVILGRSGGHGIPVLASANVAKKLIVFVLERRTTPLEAQPDVYNPACNAALKILTTSPHCEIPARP